MISEVDLPGEVFHYTSKDVALEKILYEKRLRLSQFKFTNDPKESKDWVVPLAGLGIPPADFSVRDKDLIDREISKIKLREWKVLCVSKNHPNLETATANEKARMRESYPFLSGDCRPRMWASYASENAGENRGKHTGVCIRFNGSKLDEHVRTELSSQYQIFRGSVEYNDDKLFKPPELLIELSQYSKDLSQKAREHLLEHYRDYFLLKSNDWEMEYEYRWIIHNNKDGPEYVSIEGTIEEVVMGADFPSANEPSLLESCKTLGIQARRMRWINGIPDPISI
jgi:hypothetical protein